MLTRNEKLFIAGTGLVPADRMRALSYALRAMSSDARAAASAMDKDTHAAAALRGKGHALKEAALMVEQVLAGCAMRPRSYSAARRKAREFGLRRRAKRGDAHPLPDGERITDDNGDELEHGSDDASPDCWPGVDR